MIEGCSAGSAVFPRVGLIEWIQKWYLHHRGSDGAAAIYSKQRLEVFSSGRRKYNRHSFSVASLEVMNSFSLLALYFEADVDV